MTSRRIAISLSLITSLLGIGTACEDSGSFTIVDTDKADPISGLTDTDPPIFDTDPSAAYTDEDADGVTADVDCDDDNADVYPGAPEIADSTDNDCDDLIDEGTEVYDDDGDGFAEVDGDCDDDNDAIFPDAAEAADTLDNDCDGLTDEGTDLFDDDGDGFSEVDGDCDDDNPDQNPDQEEVYDQLDNDCDSLIDEGTPFFDDDGDGFSEAEGDCDDGNDTIFQGAEELNDNLDNDCNGWADDYMVCTGAVGDYSTIQAAINNSIDGWTVAVCPGTWDENVVINNRNITLTSLSSADPATIRGDGGSSVVQVTNAQDVSVMGLILTGGQAEDGGGLRCDDAELNLMGNVITDNNALNNGGGVAAEDCTIQFSDNEVTNNIAGNYGGGMYIEDSDGNVDGNLLADNESYEGGGLFIDEGGGGGFFGGGGGAETNVRNNEMRNNFVSTIDEESWGGHGGGGGGLWYDGDSEISGNLIIGNESLYNGGGVFTNYGKASFIANTVQDNISHEDGAGIYTNYSEMLIQDNLFQDNEAYDDAGGLRLYRGDCDVYDNVLIGNIAGDDGGGMKVSHARGHEIGRNIYQDNSAGDAGGGLELDNDTSDVYDCEFIGNTATRGAGLHAWLPEETHILESLLFLENVASDCGGGIQLDNSEYRTDLYNVTMVDNEADDGGAICLDIFYWDAEDAPGEVEDYYEPNTLHVFNSFIYDNDAEDDGGAIYVKAGEVEASNVYFENNDAPNGAAFATKEEASLEAVNNIIMNSGGGPIAVAEDGGSIVMRFNNFWENDGGFEGTDNPIGEDGNFEANPRLDDDFTLQNNSPCINAGDPSIDDGNGSRSDIGAYGGPSGAPADIGPL
jgi:hypothetical protein